MKVLMLLYLPYPDIRVEKEVRSLLKQGHKIYILASNNGHEIEYNRADNVIVLRPKEYLYIYLWQVLRYFWGSINFIDKWLLNIVNEIIIKYQINIIHVHDLRLVKLGVCAGQRFEIPVIADLHENYPAAIHAYTADRSVKSILRRYSVDRYSRWKKYERDVLAQVNAIITVVDEAKQRVQNVCVSNSDNVYVVSNTEDIKRLSEMDIEHSIVKRYADKFMVSYIGGVDHHRGLDTVLFAMPMILQDYPEFYLVIAGGKHDAYEHYLMHLARKLGIDDHVEFVGRIPFQQVPSYIMASKMGIIPQIASEHTDYTVPHKLFQYMSLRRPLIVSDCQPLRRIVEEGHCGVVFHSQDAKDLANKFVVQGIAAMGEAAYCLARDKYNWGEDEKRLFAVYHRFMHI